MKGLAIRSVEKRVLRQPAPASEAGRGPRSAQDDNNIFDNSFRLGTLGIKHKRAGERIPGSLSLMATVASVRPAIRVLEE